MFVNIRWHNGNPICPYCGNVDKNLSYHYKNKHNECQKRFSVTSSTLFHAHKLPLQTLLSAIVLFVNAIRTSQHFNKP